MSEVGKKIIVTQEHIDQIDGWREQYEKRVIFRTSPMTTDEQLLSVQYVRDRYIRYAKKLAEDGKKPFDSSYNGPEFIFFVPSPFVALVIGAFAGAITEIGEDVKNRIPAMVQYVLDSVSKDKSKSSEDYCIHGYDLAKLNKHFRLGEVGKTWLKNIRDYCDAGNRSGGWISYVQFFREVVKVERDFSEWETYRQLGEISGPRVMLENVCVIADFPTVFKVNKEVRPHCDDGPFSEWADGTKFFAVNGVSFPAKYVLDKSLITVDIIQKETNAEVRRVMIDFFGKVRYIEESGAELVHEDEFGKLYRQRRPGDADLMMVKVVNATPEPDGTYKDYWLQVDPNAYGGLKTAQAAVASTWRKKDNSMVFAKPELYEPQYES